MACMETTCKECRWTVIDNTLYVTCPKCKSKNLIHQFDEWIHDDHLEDGE